MEFRLKIATLKLIPIQLGAVLVKLFYSSASPYVRKVVVTAIEAGLDNEIERVAPSSSVWIGNGDGEGSCMVHNPGYDFNDEILPLGATWWVKMAETSLPPIKTQEG